MGVTCSKRYRDIQQGYYPFNDTKYMTYIFCDVTRNADTIQRILAEILRISDKSNKYINGAKNLFDCKNNIQPVYIRALLIENEEIHIISREELHTVPYFKDPLQTKMNGKKCNRIIFITDQTQHQTKNELIDWFRWIGYFPFYYNPIGTGIKTRTPNACISYNDTFIRIGKLNVFNTTHYRKYTTEKRLLFHCEEMTHVISNAPVSKRKKYISRTQIQRVALSWEHNSCADIVMSIYDNDVSEILKMCIPSKRNGTKYICAFCKSFGVKKKCKGCGYIWYCDSTCQKKHWFLHRNKCKSTQKYIEYCVTKQIYQKCMLFRYAYN